jgi:uncharacterized protein
MPIVTECLSVGGMQCAGCESVIEEAVAGLPGVRRVAADYARGQVEVIYDDRRTRMPAIADLIREKGYVCAPPEPRRRTLSWNAMLWVVLGLAGFGLILFGAQWAERVNLPNFDQNLSYGLLFLIGLLTGFHCVGMCGGFVLGYTTSQASRDCRFSALCHVQYGVGKTLSYTVIGGLFGFLGSVIAFTPELRGIAGIIAGLFLFVMGLSMLKLLPGLRLGLRMPAFLRRFVQSGVRRHRGPFVIGLLNGLMIACGPLQAMYVMAAGTGSVLEGAKRLFVFGLGTLPILLGFGMMASMVSHRATERILKVSGAFVLIIGLIMVNRGLVLTGSGYDLRTLTAIAALEMDRRLHQSGAEKTEAAGYQTIRMSVTGSGYEPNAFVLRQGLPVHWVLDVRELTNCNRRIEVPALGLQINLVEGEQTVEFVPREAGVIPWSCWMGMLQGTFVVEARGDVTGAPARAVPSNAPNVIDRPKTVSWPLGELLGLAPKPILPNIRECPNRPPYRVGNQQSCGPLPKRTDYPIGDSQ